MVRKFHRCRKPGNNNFWMLENDKSWSVIY